MRIALDFDDTFTRDPKLWLAFIYRALSRKHDIRVVTFRNKDGDNSDIAGIMTGLIPVLYTGGKRKRQYCYEQGFIVDVWIDDMPEVIVEDHYDKYIPQTLINKALEDN